MRTVNTFYVAPRELEMFILEHKIDKSKEILLQVFSGVCDRGYIEELLESVLGIFPDIKIIGATTSGEIIDGYSSINSVVLSFSIFEKTSLHVYSTELAQNSYETAKKLIEQFECKAKVAITFADGLHVNGEEYINAFHDYDSNLIVAGGLAGDNAEFTQTPVFTHKGIVESGAVVVLLENEDLNVLSKASFGWENIGKKMTITKADKNRVYTIDNESAVSVYRRYLGEDIAEQLPNIGIEFPLIIQKDRLSIPRAVLRRGDDDSLIFAGNLETGDTVTFGYGNIEAILAYSKEHLESQSLHQSETIFVYSCMARVRLLGENINSELYPLQKIANVSGFFTYGEFFSQKDSHELLNQTMTLLSLSEGTQGTLEKKEAPIEIRKEQRRKSLTLKALSHLIMETSKELEEINLSLEDRVSKEIEKNRKNEQVMLQQSKLAQMGEMISMIAHQWRQPLSAISSLSQAIYLKSSLGTLDQESTLKFSSDITDHSKHLSETIDDFREFFRPKKEKKKTSFQEIVESVLKIIGVSIETKNIEIVEEFENECRLNTYPNELKQVVLNLLKNAEDALLEKKIDKPYIKIKMYKKNTTAILEISDNAGGISQEIQEKIFEPYFSTKTKKDGTGLGLYMSKIIIQEHCKGLFYFKNTQEGACFVIQISGIIDE